MNQVDLPPGRLEVLILARDEADVLPAALASLLPQLRTGDSLTVVADHCHDNTASVASQMGARVLRRLGGEPGKGRALRWWLDQTRAGSLATDQVIILDADSRALPGFVARMRTGLVTLGPVVQARLEAAVPADSQLASLAGLSEFVDQSLYDRLRKALGWPARLRGTGMAFQRWLLEWVAPGLESSVEDAELTILLAASGVPIRFEPAAVVADTKPLTRQAAINQRARWLKGQLSLIRLHPGALANLLLLGPAGWSTLSAVMFKPRTLIAGAKVVALAALVGLNPQTWGVRAAEVLLGLTLCLEAAGWLVALWLVRNRLSLGKVIAKLPAFGWVWIRSVWLAIRSRDPWLRARPQTYESQVGTTGPAPL